MMASAKLVDIIRSKPSELHSALSCSTYRPDLLDYEAVISAVVNNLALLDCSALWQLHSMHILRLEALMQMCPPGSASAASLVQVFLANKREGGDKLNAAFCNSPFSNLILVLLRLSLQPTSAFPLYPLAPSSASSSLTSLFFCSHPQAQSIRQHILVLLLLVRPAPLKQQLLSSTLLQCLSCSTSSSSSSAGTSPLSPMDLMSVLSFICHRIPTASLLSSYITALTDNAASLSYKTLPLAPHRTFLNLLIAPKHLTVTLGRQLFDLFASTVESAIAQRPVWTTQSHTRVGAALCH